MFDKGLKFAYGAHVRPENDAKVEQKKHRAKKIRSRCREVCKGCTQFWRGGKECVILHRETPQTGGHERKMSVQNKRVRITNESLNSYGTRVLTAGMNVEQYQRNPVLLYMHERGQVIGYVKDVQVDGGEVTGELMFDEASELSVRCKKQWEFGSLKMVSAGLDILETSDDPAQLVQGQTRATITKSKLVEVSLVDIGANDDAIVLQVDGQRITFGKDDGEGCPLPMLNNKPKKQEMELKQLALQLGLPETATEAEVGAKLGELLAAKEENERLQQEKATLQLAGITAAVDKAVSEQRIGAEKKDEFVTLGKDIGQERLESIFAAMSPQVKLSTLIGHDGGAGAEEPKKYAKLSEVPSDKLMELRKNDTDEYKRLYEAEYGVKCDLED
jgi:hypothetical protein